MYIHGEIHAFRAFKCIHAFVCIHVCIYMYFMHFYAFHVSEKRIEMKMYVPPSFF